MSSDAPLRGLRVIDLADEIGELAGRLFADFGADVVRVEPPQGARSRRLPPFHDSESLHFAYRNAGKRGVQLDLDDAEGRASLDSLLAGADLLIESEGPGGLEARGLDPVALAERHPHLVILRLSPFGQSGPYRDWVATDATLEAIGGLIWKAGLPDREPLLPPSPLAFDVTGVAGAFAALTALHQRRETGYGQVIDLSALEAVAQCTDWSFCSASISVAQGVEPVEVRAGSGPLYTIYRCKGGFVRLVVLSPRQWRAMWEWLGKPEAFADPFFDSFIARLQNADLLIPLYTEHFASLTMEEVSIEAQRRGIVCTPVLRPPEVLANEHFRSRKTFRTHPLRPGLQAPMAAGFHEIDGVRQGPRTPAPRVGEHDGDLSSAASPHPAPPSPRPAPGLPLRGLRVLDFGIGGVGVEAGRMFADYGADVIKVETRTYPDFIRVVLGSEMSPSFASSSRTKRGFGVNLKKPEGLALVHRLIEHSDVLIENSKTGAMDELGVGWKTVHERNPRCVMVSSQLLGSHGAWKDWIGYGPSTQPVGGMVHLWNYADAEAPAGSTSIFPDHLAGRLVAINALANLWAREEHTGRGAHGEVAQVETVVNLLGDLLWKEALEPGSVAPVGNRSPAGAPWGVFPCTGEQQWCVISIRDDEDWARLVEALGAPDWAKDPAWQRAEARLAAREELEAQLADWTRSRDKHEITALLQRHRVPCAPMLTGAEQIRDPQLEARGFPRWIEQQDIGRICFEGPAFRASGMAPIAEFQAPRLGEHSEEIARTLLGLDTAEIARLFADGVLEAPPEPTG